MFVFGLTLDLIQISNQQQRFVGHRRGRILGFVELPARVRPAADLGRLASGKDRIVTGVGIGLNESFVIAQKVHRPGPLTGRRIIEDHILLRIDVDPQIPLAHLRAWTVTNRHRRIVGMQLRSGQDLSFHRHHQRLQQRRTLSHPIAQGRARQVQAVTAIDPFLTMQRDMIGVLADQDVTEQPRAGPTFIDGTIRQVGDHHPVLAVFACILGTNVLADHKRSRHIVQLFADLFADPGLGSTAAGASQLGLGHRMLDRLSRQMGRQGDATVATRRGRLGPLGGSLGRRGGFCRRRLRGDRVQQIKQDRMVGRIFLRTPAERVTLEPGQLLLQIHQMYVLGVDVGQQTQHHLTQRRDIVGQGLGRRVGRDHLLRCVLHDHTRSLSSSSDIVHYKVTEAAVFRR